MSPEGHLQPTSQHQLQPTNNPLQVQQALQGHFQPIACHIQPSSVGTNNFQSTATSHLQPSSGHLQSTAAGHLQSTGGHLQPTGGHLQPTGGHLQPNAIGHINIQPTLSQFPFIQTASLPAGGTSYVYQLVGQPLAGSAVAQSGYAAAPQTGSAASAQYSLIGYQPVFPFGSTSNNVAQIKTEHGGSTNMQIAFNAATNQIQAFPLQQQPQLHSLYPQLQQLQFQPVPVSPQQQLLCSPQFLAAVNNPPQPAVVIAPATAAVVGKKKSARKPSVKKAAAKQQPANSGEKTVMPEPDKPDLLLSEYLREGLDIVLVLQGDDHATASAIGGRNIDNIFLANHIWPALEAAGLVANLDGEKSPLSSSPLIKEGSRLLEADIGLVSVPGASDFSGGQKLFADTALAVLHGKLVRNKPKIVVFHGKALYEAFCVAQQRPPSEGNANAGTKVVKVPYYGRQPDFVSGSEIVPWVMPDSSSGCATLPHSRDKLIVCYRALKKLRDFHKSSSRLPRPTDAELTFCLSSLASRGAAAPRRVRKEEFILRQEDAASDRRRLPKGDGGAALQRDETSSTSVQSLKQVRKHLSGIIRVLWIRNTL
jgi:hypothetical protein